MPSFDILGSNLYGQDGGPSGFDIIAPNAGAPSQNGQNSPVFNSMPLAGQPQGSPVSGLVAGALGMPTYGGAVPGAAYLTPGQGQPNGGQVQQPQQMSPLMAGILGVNQGSNGNAANPQALQPQNTSLASALGSSAGNLFDGVIGLGR